MSKKSKRTLLSILGIGLGLGFVLTYFNVLFGYVQTYWGNGMKISFYGVSFLGDWLTATSDIGFAYYFIAAWLLNSVVVSAIVGAVLAVYRRIA